MFDKVKTYIGFSSKARRQQQQSQEQHQDEVTMPSATSDVNKKKKPINVERLKPIYSTST